MRVALLILVLGLHLQAVCAEPTAVPATPPPAPAAVPEPVAETIQKPVPAVPKFVLPTENHALIDGKEEDYYQFVDRNLNGAVTQVWEGGKFGFVRNPVTLKTGEQLYARFHEGLDIKPLQRDAKGEPLDEVRSIADGEVVHCANSPSQSNYGRYLVVRHDWGEGPFCSLYAHLSAIRCKEGDKVTAGTTIGVMGHTGAGIDQRRSHTHVELCLILSTRFAAWHDTSTNTLNYHGIWNGLNLVGFDLSRLFAIRAKDPNASITEMVKSSPEHFRISVPGKTELELLENYPWLCSKGVPAVKPNSWIISFTAWGLPVKIEPSDDKADSMNLVWVTPSTLPQFTLTRGLITGTSARPSLSNDGVSYCRLATGSFTVKPRAATPVEAAPTPKKKKKK